jgi:hypothetical protein
MARHPVNPGDDTGKWLQEALPLCVSVQMLGLSHRPVARISRPSLIIAKRAVAFPIRQTTRGHSLHSPGVEGQRTTGTTRNKLYPGVSRLRYTTPCACMRQASG